MKDDRLANLSCALLAGASGSNYAGKNGGKVLLVGRVVDRKELEQAVLDAAGLTPSAR